MPPETAAELDAAYLARTFEACPFHRHMNLELEVLGSGKVAVIARYKPELDQGMGILHGGVFAAALDTATYYAVLSHYGRSGKLPLTQEYKLNLLAPAQKEDIRAVAELVKAGRSVAVAEAKVFTLSGKLCAAGMASMLIRG
jgi:uncharacterized protein (TIGR00369 family)